MKSIFEVQTDLNWVEFFSFVRFDYQTTTASTKITTRSKPLSSPSSHVNSVDQKIRAKLKKLEKSRLHQHISSKDKLPTRISFGHFAPGMLAKPKAFIFDTAIVKKCCQKWYIIWFNFDSNEMSIRTWLSYCSWRRRGIFQEEHKETVHFQASTATTISRFEQIHYI